MDHTNLPVNFKPPYLSKTLIFNILAVLVLIAQYFGFSDFHLDPTLQALIVAAANFGLRFVTRTSIIPRG